MKRFAKITAIGLSCALAFSLAACGGDDDGVNQNNAPDPDSIKTEQVTESEWQNAFDFSSVTNVTFKRSVVDSTMASLPPSVLPHGAEQYRIAKFDGDKVSVERKEYEINMSSPSYANFIDETKYYYSDSDTNYVYNYNESSKKYDKEEMEDGDDFPEISYYTDMVTGWATLYNDFEYSASKGAYYFEEVNDNGQGQVITDECIIKITDGKLSVYQYLHTVELDGIAPSTTTTMLQAYDYGKTKVALPDGSGESDKPADGSSEVTEAQWNAALSTSAFYNVTVTDTMDMGGIIESKTYKIDSKSGCFYKELENGEEYITVYVEDNIGLVYKLVDDKWEYNGYTDHTSVDGAIEMYILSTVSVFNYRAFTLRNGKYTATNYTAPGMNGMVVDEAFLTFESGRLVKCEYTMSSNKVTGTFTMEFTDYGTTSFDKPNIDEIPGGGGSGGGGSSSWDTSLNGKYYYEGKEDDETNYLKIDDGKVFAIFGDVLESKIDENSITVKIMIKDKELGVIYKMYKGTIGDGVITFLYIATYDEEDTLIKEDTNAKEIYIMETINKK